ncbi:MAG: endo-1,4-beta-xylanase [Cytophagaceae bacterium]|jgi:GH35 family endo-1,4-beta-xylanase|nr:endo-1,4-beta-xylanase [Cytophagaceae bacterium]
MKINHRIYKCSIILGFICLLCIKLNAQIPPGGVNIISPIENNYSFWDNSGTGSIQLVQVSGQSFTSALQITTIGRPNETWLQQTTFTEIGGIENGDVVLYTFWGRVQQTNNESGAGFAMAVVENASDYSKELFTPITLSNQWQELYVSFQAVQNLTAAQLNIALHTGYANQTIQIAQLQVINYKKTRLLSEMPKNIISYEGRDLNAEWRISANQRIDQFRKGDLNVIVNNFSGSPLVGADVCIKMLDHSFGFGTAINAHEFENNTQYRDTALALFNQFTIENDMKWWLYVYPTEKARSRRIVDYLLSKGKQVRGHNIIWPSFSTGYSPSFLLNYRNNADSLRFYINQHIDDIVTEFKGDLVDWDVINEPNANTDYMNVLGFDEMARWYNRTHQIDSNVKLFVNDYSILEAGGVDYAKQDAYYSNISRIINDGGHLDGIGIQGHFSTQLTPINRLYEILDRFSTFQKEIKITEFDINIRDQWQVQADYTRDFMTLVFSHPSVTSFLMWGFWENAHWIPDAAMYSAQWSPKPNLIEYKKLVFDTWWTKELCRYTNTNGTFNPERVFLGKYEIEVDFNGIIRKDTIDIINNTLLNTITFNLPTTVTSTTEVQNKNISVYPNPSSTSFVIECSQNLYNEVEVYTTSGILINKEKIINSQFTFGENLPCGIYFLKVNNEHIRIVKL